MITFGDIYDVQRALIWLTGSVYARSWEEFWALVPWVAILAPLAFLLARDLNALNLGEEVARGLVNYSASECRRIARKPTAEIEKLLGYIDEPELIHRDNMVER